MPPEIASKIDDRYEVLGELGRGGMGVVYKANDLKMDRLVAIKVMTAHSPGRDEYQERFLREAKSIAKMQHPNIVVVYDFGYHSGAPYIAMEYVEGVPLDKVIASRLSLTPLTKVDYIVQVCHALHYAHQLGIIHRDVKPGNIMVLEGGRRVKLLDFGIARAGAPSKLSRSGLAMGTTCYMSPEQTQGKKDLDARADIFSAGVVLYELLAGKQPWTGESDYEVMTKIIHEPVPPLAGLSNYPAALDRVLELALAKEPGGRYGTAEKMAQALSELEAPLKERALEEALVQFEHGDLLRANDLVSQILRIDTRHREAIELRVRLQQVAQLQQRSEQVRQLRTAAEEAVGQKRYSEALAAVEQAITIDSANTELFHYRELIRNEVKRREDIRKKLELARHAQEMNDLSTAQELVERALEADPTDTQARMMKSSLEQERKKQQLQEIADETARVLSVRAFARAREFIQQLESLDPNFAGIPSLKKALAEGEAEEKRRVELENLIRDVRRVLESGAVPQSLSITQQALVRFPGEPRLVRLRAQAEAMRDAAEREDAVQKQLVQAKTLVEKGHSAQALAAAETALRQLGSDHRLQSLVAQLRHTVEREQLVQAEQSVLAQARNALRASDFESAVRILAPARASFPNSQEIADALQVAQAGLAKKADTAERQRKLQAEQTVLAQAQKLMESGSFPSAVKILTPARLDFPNSREIADALQAAQAAIARKAEMDAQEARKREIAEALERALAGESDPNLQVGLAEEAVRRIPGNTAAERALERVRERQRKIATAVEYARKFEQAQRYAESIQQWEAVRKLWPECPNLDAQIERLKTAQKPPAATAKPPAPVERFSATSIMEAVPAPAPSPGMRTASAPAETAPAAAPPKTVAAAITTGNEPPAVVERAADRGLPPVRPNKVLFAVIAAVVVVVAVPVLYLVLRPKPGASTEKKISPPPIPAAKPATPVMGTLTVRTNVDHVDIIVDGSFKGSSDGQEKTISVTPGAHTISVEKNGYSAPPQPVQISSEQNVPLSFTLSLNTAEQAAQPRPTWLTIVALPGARVRINKEQGLAEADGSFSRKITNPEKPQRVEVSLDGYRPWTNTINLKVGDRLTVTADLKAIPKPPEIVSFAPNPATIQEGDSVELKWETRNATDVTIDNGVGRVGPSSSTKITPKGTGQMRYTMQASGDGGTTQRTVTVMVAAAAPKPVISTFEAGVDKIHQGDSVKLIWTTQNATDAYISAEPGPDVGKVAVQGPKEVRPTKTTTYTLIAKGANQTEERHTAQVVVEAAQLPAPTPAPTIVQATPPPVATPVVVAEDPANKAVSETMDRYRDAYEVLDLDGVKKVWPQMPKETERGLQELFQSGVRAIKLHMACKNPIVHGDSADVTCPQKPELLKGKNDRRYSDPYTQVFKLQKDKGHWVIVSAITR
jgi:serine/threonine-protein kinase